MATSRNTLEVLYEDNHLLIINKKVGDLVQGDKTGDRPLSEIAKQYLKKKYDKKGNVFLGVTHRLDRVTSGLVIFPKTSKSLSRLNKMFQERKIEKTYWAVTPSRMRKDEGALSHWLLRKPKLNKSFAYRKEIENGKLAVLHYKLLATSERYFLWEIKPATGRHHQIRVQLAAVNCPIKGDLKYGAKRSNANGGIHLHAHRLQFEHPVSKSLIDIKADPPVEKVWDVFGR